MNGTCTPRGEGRGHEREEGGGRGRGGGNGGEKGTDRCAKERVTLMRVRDGV